MTRFLIDTHIFLWWHDSSPQLGSQLRRQIASRQNEVHFSAISSYEIELKRNLGKLRISDYHAELVDSRDFILLPVTMAHAELAGRLPLHNRDPFDRILVAQAIIENLVLITGDANIRRFDVPVLQAGN